MTLLQRELQDRYVYMTKRLPEEYQEVEHIGTTGTQWIDTGLVCKSGYKIDLKYYTNSSSNIDQTIIGCSVVDGNTPLYRGVNYNSSYRSVYFNYNNTWHDIRNSQAVGNTYEGSVTLRNGNQNITLNGNTVYSATDNLSQTGTTNLFLFTSRGTNYALIKLYYMKIYDENDNLIRDFVPCYRKQDTVIGLYDLVNNQFYTNSGTGTFTKGNNQDTPGLKNVTGVYIGNGDSTATKIRPVWKPGANTLCRYTFDNTLADASLNHADASNISSCTFVEAYTGSTKKVLNKPSGSYISLPATFLQTAISEYTMIFWFKSTQTSQEWLMGGNSSSDYDGNVLGGIDDNVYKKFGFLYGRTYSYRRIARNASTYRDGNWHLMSIRRGTGDVIIGIDKNYTTTYELNTPIDYSIGGNGVKRGIGTRSTDSGGGIQTTSIFQLGDFIVEDKFRTDQELSDYYDLIKGNYGL